MNPDSQASPGAWSSRRVLVTGADGFVGRWLVPALLERGARVWALVWSKPHNVESAGSAFDGTNAEVVTGDITDLKFVSGLVADSGLDTVYHLAAINTNTGSGLSPYQLFETNTRGVYTVLEACRTSPRRVRFVISSSKEVEDCFVPGTRRKRHPYMASKAAAELVARAYGDTFGFPVVVARSDNLYGGNDFNWERLIPGTIRSLVRDERPVIRSNGLLQRDYVYVEDAVAAFLAIGEKLDQPEVSGQLFRIATGTGTTTLDIVKHLVRIAGASHLEPAILNQKSEERVDTIYTPEFERTVLGWKSHYSLEQGLSRTWHAYAKFFGKQGV